MIILPVVLIIFIILAMIAFSLESYGSSYDYMVVENDEPYDNRFISNGFGVTIYPPYEYEDDIVLVEIPENVIDNV